MNKINFLASLVGLVFVIGISSSAQATIASPRAIVIERGSTPTNLNIYWVNPDSVSLDHINLYLSTLPLQQFGKVAEISGVNALPNQIGKCTIGNLSASIEYYYFYLTAVDRDGNESVPTATLKRRLGISEDLTSTLPVNSVSINNATATSLQINWTNPVEEDFYRVAIYRSTDFIVPKTETNRIGYKIGLPSGVMSYIDKTLTASTAYYYRLVAEDVRVNESDAVIVAGGTTLAVVIQPPVPPVVPPVASQPVVVPITASQDYQAVWVDQNGSLNAKKTAHVIYAHPGDDVSFMLTLKNTGKATWHANTVGDLQELRIGTSILADRISKFATNDWVSSNRAVGLTQDILSGETTTFSWIMQVPINMKPGAYREYFRPVAEYIKWFGPTGIFWDIIVN